MYTNQRSSHLKAEPARKLEPASTSLELEASTASTSSTLPEEELLTPRSLSKRTAVERLPLLFRVIWIIAPVKPRSQLGIDEHFIRLVDLCHLLRRLLFGYTQGACLVRVVFLGHCSIGFFDCAVVRVGRDAEDFVVVFCLAAFEQGVRLLEERLYILGSGMVFLCEVEGADGGFKIFRIKLGLSLSDQTGERVSV